MNIIEPISIEKLKEEVPELMKAITSEELIMMYCDICDGIRTKDHTCVCWYCIGMCNFNECKCPDNPANKVHQ